MTLWKTDSAFEYTFTVLTFQLFVFKLPCQRQHTRARTDARRDRERNIVNNLEGGVKYVI